MWRWTRIIWGEAVEAKKGEECSRVLKWEKEQSEAATWRKSNRGDLTGRNEAIGVYKSLFYFIAIFFDYRHIYYECYIFECQMVINQFSGVSDQHIHDWSEV